MINLEKRKFEFYGLPRERQESETRAGRMTEEACSAAFIQAQLPERTHSHALIFISPPVIRAPLDSTQKAPFTELYLFIVRTLPLIPLIFKSLRQEEEKKKDQRKEN